jgi:protein O-GlcNAc transferase
MSDIRAAAVFKAALRTHQQGDLANAARMYGEVLSLAPEHAPAHFLLGMVLLAGRQLDTALVHAGEAVRLAPDNASYRQGLAETRLALGEVDRADLGFRMTVLCNPSVATPWSWLGERLEVLGDLPAAERFARRARYLAEDGMTTITHAAILSRLGDVETAWPLADRATHMGGRYDPLCDLKSALMLPPIPRDRDQISEARQRFSDMLDRVADSDLRLADPASQIGRTPFYLAYHGEDDLDLARRFSDVLHAATPTFQEQRPDAAASTGRRRVGIFSTFFNAHTILRYTRGLIQAMAARDDLEVIVLPTMSMPAPARDHLRSLGATVTPVSHDYRQAVGQIRAMGLDVLVFADVGMEPLSGALAHTDLARRQIVLSGHPVTTGIRRMDGYVVCPQFEPPGFAGHYREPLIEAPFWPLNYVGALTDPASLAEPDRDRSRPSLICAQSLFKIHPDMDGCFREILERVPSAQLYFIGMPERLKPVTDRFRHRLQTAGIDLDRHVRFLPYMAARTYLGWIRHADVLLDSWHFSGGDSTLAALAAGGRIVTHEGAFYRGRQTAGLLREIGLDETVATTPQAYVEIVEKVATDPAYAAHLRSQVEVRGGGVFRRLDGADTLIDGILGAA